MANDAEFLEISRAVAVGLLVMGFIGFAVKLVNIPINNILVCCAFGKRADSRLEGISEKFMYRRRLHRTSADKSSETILMNCKLLFRNEKMATISSTFVVSLHTLQASLTQP